MKKIGCILFCMYLSASAVAAGPVLVEEGGVALTKDDFYQNLQYLLKPEDQRNVLSDEKLVRNFVAQLFATKRLASEVDEKSLSADERARLDIIKTRELVKIKLEREFAKITDDVLEKAAHENYLANPDLQRTPEEVHAEHILIATASRSKEDALALAKDVEKRAKKGEKFEDLAKQYSEDKGSAQRGGDLGFFKKGRMVGPFEDAAFSLKKNGDITEPVETKFGYHIIRLVERKDSKPIPFDSIKTRLKSEAERNLRKDVAKNEYQRIGKLPEIKSNQDAILSLVVNEVKKEESTKSNTAKN